MNKVLREIGGYLFAALLASMALLPISLFFALMMVGAERCALFVAGVFTGCVLGGFWAFLPKPRFLPVIASIITAALIAFVFTREAGAPIIAFLMSAIFLREAKASTRMIAMARLLVGIMISFIAFIALSFNDFFFTIEGFAGSAWDYTGAVLMPVFALFVLICLWHMNSEALREARGPAEAGGSARGVRRGNAALLILISILMLALMFLSPIGEFIASAFNYAVQTLWNALRWVVDFFDRLLIRGDGGSGIEGGGTYETEYFEPSPIWYILNIALFSAFGLALLYLLWKGLRPFIRSLIEKLRISDRYADFGYEDEHERIKLNKQERIGRRKDRIPSVSYGEGGAEQVRKAYATALSYALAKDRSALTMPPSKVMSSALSGDKALADDFSKDYERVRYGGMEADGAALNRAGEVYQYLGRKRAKPSKYDD